MRRRKHENQKQGVEQMSRRGQLFHDDFHCSHGVRNLTFTNSLGEKVVFRCSSLNNAARNKICNFSLQPLIRYDVDKQACCSSFGFAFTYRICADEISISSKYQSRTRPLPSVTELMDLNF